MTNLLSDLRFETLGKLLAYVDQTPAWPKAICQSRDKNMGSWSGSETFPEAMTLARHGWTEGRAYMQKSVNAIATATAHNPLQWFAYDVAGFFPHVPRAIAGEPLNMVHLEPQENTVKPIVSLAYQNNSGSHYKAEELLNFGAAFVSICDALEQAGYRTDITAFSYVSTSRGNVFASVNVKRPEEPFDIDRMAFTLAHPSMLRRVWFGSYEQDKALQPHLSGHYGRPIDLTKGILDPDTIIVRGVRMFEHGSNELKTPLNAFNAALPKILKLLNLENAGV